ncbi:MAG: 3'-5' exonuclease [Ruminococcus sp.]|nr:3'-5' exonuclease [Ruminococcus sp.]
MKKVKDKVWRDLPSTLKELKAFLNRHEYFVFFDTETTGLKPGQDRVIQLSGIMVNRKFDIIKKYNEYSNPSPVIISSKITEITGITNTDVENARPEFEVLTDFLQDTSKCGYFAYNSPYDVAMVTKSMAREGVEVEMDSFDVLKFARDVLANEKMENHKLKTVSDYLGVTPETENFHNALFDVEMTISVFKALLRKAKTLDINQGYQRPRVFSLRPWEAGMNKRIYVQTSAGSVWFDKIKQVWGAKDAPIEQLDMSYIEAEARRMANEAGFETLQKVNVNI